MNPKLRSWTELTDSVGGLPPLVAAALCSGRRELLLMADDTAFTPAETRAVLKLVAVLLDTNQELQRHSREVAERLRHVRDTLAGLYTQVDTTHDFANFRGSEEDT